MIVIFMFMTFVMYFMFWLFNYKRLVDFFPYQREILVAYYILLFVFSIVYLYIVYKNIQEVRLKEEVHFLQELKDIKKYQKEETESYIQRQADFQKKYIDELKLMKRSLEAQQYIVAKNQGENIYQSFQENKMKTYCQDAFINAVLQVKMNKALKNHISMQYRIVLPDDIKIDALVLPTILFNILDNALRACGHQENAFIELTLTHRQNFISIHLVNTNYQKNANNDMGMHGYGLTIVEELVTRYNGVYEWNDRGNTFESMIMLRYGEECA